MRSKYAFVFVYSFGFFVFDAIVSFYCRFVFPPTFSRLQPTEPHHLIFYFFLHSKSIRRLQNSVAARTAAARESSYTKYEKKVWAIAAQLPSPLGHQRAPGAHLSFHIFFLFPALPRGASVCAGFRCLLFGRAASVFS